MVEEHLLNLEGSIRAEIISAGMLQEELEALLCGRPITTVYAQKPAEHQNEYFSRVCSEIMADYIYIKSR